MIKGFAARQMNLLVKLLYRITDTLQVYLEEFGPILDQDDRLRLQALTRASAELAGELKEKLECQNS